MLETNFGSLDKSRVHEHLHLPSFQTSERKLRKLLLCLREACRAHQRDFLTGALTVSLMQDIGDPMLAVRYVAEKQRLDIQRGVLGVVNVVLGWSGVRGCIGGVWFFCGCIGVGGCRASMKN